MPHISTPRLRQAYRSLGNPAHPAILMVHGNASSSIFWEEQMELLANDFYCIAPDLRGFGDTEDFLIDATRGFGDHAYDLLELLDALNLQQVHAIGHSLGGGVLYTLVGKAPARFKSVTLVNPASPFGFGGTKDVQGSPCFPDFAGSGGGIVNPDFPKLIAAGDRSADNPQASPRMVMNAFYWKSPFTAPREEALLDGLLSEKIGEDRYPGDFVASENYPFTAPGRFGPINASSPKYLGDSVARFEATSMPVLWVRGSDDQIVSDNSFFDLGTLGKLGFIPGYPGEAVYPSQPMVSQTRYVLERRKGPFTELVMADTGHSPYIEKPQEFYAHFSAFLKQNA
jgi:pimeloyl-ACP methyl ester carboxylesterase